MFTHSPYICFKFTLNSPGSRRSSRLIALHLSLMVELFVADIQDAHKSQSLQLRTRQVLCMTEYAYCTLYKFMRLSFGVAAAATTQRAGVAVASIRAMRTCISASCLWSKVSSIDMSGAALGPCNGSTAGNGSRPVRPMPALLGPALPLPCPAMRGAAAAAGVGSTTGSWCHDSRYLRGTTLGAHAVSTLGGSRSRVQRDRLGPGPSADAGPPQASMPPLQHIRFSPDWHAEQGLE